MEGYAKNRINLIRICVQNAESLHRKV